MLSNYHSIQSCPDCCSVWELQHYALPTHRRKGPSHRGMLLQKEGWLSLSKSESINKLQNRNYITPSMWTYLTTTILLEKEFIRGMEQECRSYITLCAMDHEFREGESETTFHSISNLYTIWYQKAKTLSITKVYALDLDDDRRSTELIHALWDCFDCDLYAFDDVVARRTVCVRLFLELVVCCSFLETVHGKTV